MWRQIITAKIRNQASNLANLKRASAVLREIAGRCHTGTSIPPRSLPTPCCAAGSLPDSVATSEGPDPGWHTESRPQRVSLASLSPKRRAGLHADTPDACESRAARHYWKHLLPRLSDWQQSHETHRAPGTRQGVNGMLDYGYAIVRTAVLRALATHGFIAALGIAHTAKAGSFALADDLMEPLRPFIDRELRTFLQGGPRPMEEWIKQVVKVLALEVSMDKGSIRLLSAIDLYVGSFAQATQARASLHLKIPML